MMYLTTLFISTTLHQAQPYTIVLSVSCSFGFLNFSLNCKDYFCSIDLIGFISSKEMRKTRKYKTHSNLSIKGTLCVTLLSGLNISPPGISRVGLKSPKTRLRIM